MNFKDSIIYPDRWWTKPIVDDTGECFTGYPEACVPISAIKKRIAEVQKEDPWWISIEQAVMREILDIVVENE